MTLVDLLQSSPGLFVAATFLLGLFVGSFLNVVIHRLPIMLEREWRQQCAELVAPVDSRGGAAQNADADTNTEATNAPVKTKPDAPFNLIVPRSRCPACNAPIHAWQNIPLVSYALLRGKCAACGTRISLRYPIVELLTGVLSALVAWRYGFGWPTLGALILTWSLIALSGIDLDTKYLPDIITLPLLWLGLLAGLALRGDNGLALPVDPRSGIIGAAVGYLSLWSIYHLFKLLTKKEGMGYGDFKLFAALGAWMGAQMLLPIILFASFTGAVIGIALIVARRLGRDAEIPFGPYLAAAGWIAMMWGPEIVDRYLRLMDPRGV